MSPDDEGPGETCLLTRYRIWNVDSTLETGVIPLPEGIIQESNLRGKYLLGIFAPARDFFKVTSYYLDTPRVVKVTLVFDVITPDHVKKASELLARYPERPLHVSGFCNKNGKYIYEMYLLDKNKEEMLGFVQELEKSGFKFEYFIEEINISDQEPPTDER